MMIRVIALAFITILFAGASILKSITIRGTIKGDNPPRKIYIYELFGNFPYKLDSAIVNNRKVEFKRNKGFTPGFYKIGISEEQSDLLILSDESFDFDLNVGNNSVTLDIKGSRENELFSAYQAFNQHLNQQVNQLSSKFQSLNVLANKNKDEYEKQLNAIKSDYDKLVASQSEFLNKLEKENTNLFMGKLAQFIQEKRNTPKEDFFQIGLLKENPGLLTSDLMQTKFQQYLQMFQVRDASMAMDEARQIIQSMPVGSKIREVAYQAFAITLMQYDAPGLRKFVKEAVDEFGSKYSKRLYEFMPFVPEIGEKAPDIILPDVNGKNFSLSSIKGKVILLDFWASWCGPCRHENPNVVKAYHKFKDKGFTVFSVSLDNNKEKWLEAISKDGLVWENHVSDLKGWQSAGARKYGVSGIPATFLIDQNGVIVAKNLRGAQLEQKLSELLK